MAIYKDTLFGGVLETKNTGGTWEYRWAPSEYDLRYRVWHWSPEILEPLPRNENGEYVQLS